MSEQTYITLQVPEHLYLAVCGFMGTGAKPPMTVADVPDELVAEIVMQAQPIPDHEIDRLGEALHSAETQNNEQAELIGKLQQGLRERVSEAEVLTALKDRQAARIRELEAERNEWRTKAEREQRRYDQLAPLYDALLARTAAPEESTEAAAAPEPTVPAPSRPEATPPSGALMPEPGLGWKSAQARRGVPGAWTKPESKAAEAAAERFVAACLRKKPGGKLLAADLPAAYARWAKGRPDVPAEVQPRWLGGAAKRAGFVAKVLHRPFPHVAKSAQTYVDIEVVDEESDADRRKREVAEVRELAKKARANGAREIVVDDKPVAPYIEPKPKPKPGKQPILAVRNADQRPTLKDYSQVRVIRSDGVVTHVDAMDWIDPDEDTEPIKPEDADRRTFDLWTEVNDGMRDRKLGYLPDVLALEGVNTDELEATVKHPSDVEIRPETRSKGYPVLGFRRGDVKVIVGFRDQQKPAVIAAYWDALLTPDSHVVYRHGGGGAKKISGLPTTVKQSVTHLKRRGFVIPDDWEKATQPVEVKYDGQVLGKMKVHLANKQQVQGDYQRLLRQAHAIDRRKGLVPA